MQTIKLWDAPLRIFHWSLALLVTAALVTGLSGGALIDWHGRIGAAIAALLGFRLVWGVVGSTYARFATFVKGPASVIAYLKGQWRGIGHNPLGALSVIAMLGFLSLQVLTGLPASDDVAFRGPYNVLVSKDTELLALYLHQRIAWAIAVLLVLHLAAIAYYARANGDNLVKPMLTGRKELPRTPGGTGEEIHHASGGNFVALLIALATAGLVAWVALGGPVEYLAPPLPAAETPNW